MKADFEFPDWCWECCLRHSPGRRQAILRRMGADVTVREALDAWPHFWADTEAGLRMFHRDMRATFGVRPSNLRPDRLEEAVRLVIEEGWPTHRAVQVLHVNRPRLRDALYAAGYKYERHAKAEQSGWRRKERREAV